jgi:hypothetical protein
MAIQAFWDITLCTSNVRDTCIFGVKQTKTAWPLIHYDPVKGG